RQINHSTVFGMKLDCFESAKAYAQAICYLKCPFIDPKGSLVSSSLHQMFSSIRSAASYDLRHKPIARGHQTACSPSSKKIEGGFSRAASPLVTDVDY